MARKQRRTRRRKNPTTAQCVVLGIGSVAGLGLLGYGIYRVVRKPATPEISAGGFGAGVGAQIYSYVIGGGEGNWLPVVYDPQGKVETLPTVPTYEGARQAAIAHIIRLGGVPRSGLVVGRDLSSLLQEEGV